MLNAALGVAYYAPQTAVLLQRLQVLGGKSSSGDCTEGAYDGVQEKGPPGGHLCLVQGVCDRHSVQASGWQARDELGGQAYQAPDLPMPPPTQTQSSEVYRW